MSDSKQIKLNITGLDCANCAAKVERKINEMKEVTEATIDFLNKKLILTSDEESPHTLITSVQKVIDSIENGVTISPVSSNITTNNIHGHHNHTHGHLHGHAHDHSHSHSHDHGTDELKKLIGKIIIGGILFIGGFIIPENSHLLRFITFFASYVVIGGDVLTSAFKNILKGQIFDENFLMSIATVGAFAIGEYPEGVAVMLFYQLGELFQGIAVNRSRNSIADLMDIRPDYANLKTGNDIEKVSPDSVKIGDFIVVKPGEKVPLDGEVVEGHSAFDTSALTGESLPREISPGENVLSGFINRTSLITVKVTKLFSESTVAKILDLVENSTAKKSRTENFITKFARYYTPVVVILALLIAILPPFIIPGVLFKDSLYRALIFLVVSCPCALVISIPLGFFGGIGSASRHGILIKGANYLEALNNVDTVVMDKTGTLTKGVFKVTEINVNNNISNGISEDELLKLAAHAESFSTHPIAQSIVRAYEEKGNTIDKSLLNNFEEKSGYGIKVNIDGQSVTAGNYRLMELENITIDEKKDLGTVVYVATDGNYIGNILIADEIKKDAEKAVSGMKENGVKNIVMLTGDTKAIGESTANRLNIDKVYTELLPDQKVEKLEEIFKEKSDDRKVVFVGDGINDAPVLARADIGIAMGGLGSDAAIEASDVVIMNDEPSKIVTALKIARSTRAIVWQNIFFAAAVKIIVLILGAGGLATMWEAVFADVGVALLAVLNAMRIIRKKFD